MKNPLVVGYRGEIGRYILNGLLDYMPSATPILCFDMNDTLDERVEKIKNADVIFLCVPIQLTMDFIFQWQNFLKGKTIIEQTSLKGLLYSDPRFKKTVQGITLLSMHILFRPSATPNKEDQSIAIIANSQKELDTWHNSGVADFIKHGLKVPFFSFPTWHSHDKEMAIQQALVHRVLLVLDNMISEGCSKGTPRSKTNTFMGKQVSKLALRIKQGDYGLYKIIQDNPALNRKLREFNSQLENFDLAKHMKKCGDK